jgi:[acyl-carrier-protein] S-malonyltransferase
MEPAAHVMAAAFAEAKVQSPLVPLYANVTAGPVTDPQEIVRLLVAQVTGTVRWRESVEAMIEAGTTEFVEFGGKVLGPMIKRINPDVTTRSVVTMADVETLAKDL